MDWRGWEEGQEPGWLSRGEILIAERRDRALERERHLGGEITQLGEEWLCKEHAKSLAC